METATRRVSDLEHQAVLRSQETTDDMNSRRSADRQRHPMVRWRISSQAADPDIDLSNFVALPSPEQLEHSARVDATREHDAHVATLTFYLGSGHGIGPSPVSEDAIVRDQVASLIPDPVSAEGLGAGLRAFLSVYNVSKVFTCGACGSRDMATSINCPL